MGSETASLFDRRPPRRQRPPVLRASFDQELYRAQGFPDAYVIDRGPAGPLTKTAQIRLVGNSVAPPVAFVNVTVPFAVLRMLLTVTLPERAMMSAALGIVRTWHGQDLFLRSRSSPNTSAGSRKCTWMRCTSGPESRSSTTLVAPT